MNREQAIEQKRNFVNNELNATLNAAKPHLTCEFSLGQDVPLKKMDYFLMEQRNGVSPYFDDEYVLVHCENGARYEINVSGDSLCAVACDVLNKMVGK